MKIVKLHFKNAGGDTYHSTEVSDKRADELADIWIRNAERLKDAGQIISYDISILTKEEV